MRATAAAARARRVATAGRGAPAQRPHHAVRQARPRRARVVAVRAAAFPPPPDFEESMRRAHAAAIAAEAVYRMNKQMSRTELASLLPEQAVEHIRSIEEECPAELCPEAEQSQCLYFYSTRMAMRTSHPRIGRYIRDRLFHPDAEVAIFSVPSLKVNTD